MIFNKKIVNKNDILILIFNNIIVIVEFNINFNLYELNKYF
jgi:hypothetical protein